MRSRVSHVTGRCTAETRGSDAGRPFACAWITMVHDKIRRACFHAENGTVPVAEYRGMYRETFMTLLTSPMMHRSLAFFSSNSSLLSRESKSLRRSSEKRSESSSGFEKFEERGGYEASRSSVNLENFAELFQHSCDQAQLCLLVLLGQSFSFASKSKFQRIQWGLGSLDRTFREVWGVHVHIARYMAKCEEIAKL